MPIRGWVYVLSNTQMPDLLKIGYSRKDPALRAIELHTTAVASPFKVEYDVLVFDPEVLERKLHDQLSDFRTTANREFFKATIADVVKVIRNSGFALLYEQGFDVPPLLTLVEN